MSRLYFNRRLRHSFGIIAAIGRGGVEVGSLTCRARRTPLFRYAPLRPGAAPLMGKNVSRERYQGEICGSSNRNPRDRNPRRTWAEKTAENWFQVFSHRDSSRRFSPRTAESSPIGRSKLPIFAYRGRGGSPVFHEHTCSHEVYEKARAERGIRETQ